MPIVCQNLLGSGDTKVNKMVTVLKKHAYYWEQIGNKPGNTQMNDFRYWQIPRKEMFMGWAFSKLSPIPQKLS